MVLAETLVFSRLHYGSVVWAPLAPSFPVVHPALFDSTYGRDRTWPAVEIFTRDVYRWILGL